MGVNTGLVMSEIAALSIKQLVTLLEFCFIIIPSIDISANVLLMTHVNHEALHLMECLDYLLIVWGIQIELSWP